MRSFAPDYFYHLAETSNLDSIRRHGLLSCTRLLELSKVKQDDREGILERHRKDSMVLAKGIMIRDQKPMPPHLLARALPADYPPAQWYRLLNNFVFLWPNRERARRQAGACQGRPQSLLVLDAGKILDGLRDKIYFSPINSGNARRQAAKRAPQILVPYSDWLACGWMEHEGKRRPASHRPVEILVRNELPLEPYLRRIENFY